MDAAMILGLIRLARELPHLVADILAVARSGQDPTPEQLASWEARADLSRQARDQVIADAEARLRGQQP